jgi:hypothetical protein
VNTHAKINTAFRCGREVSLGHLRLNFLGAGKGIDGAGELDEEPIASPFDNAAVMGGDRRVDQFVADRPELFKRAPLVGSDQPRVSRRIRGENGGKAAGCRHFARSLSTFSWRLAL